jgi:hypothetical protein
LPFEKERFCVAYQEYFKGKRKNFFCSMTEFKDLWDALQLLNDIWMRELSNLEHLRDATQMLPKLLFNSAHSRFLTAVELGFSCCIGDAYSVLRDGIEAVVHAHKICVEPATALAWSAKHKGRAEQAAYRKIFEEKKKESLFPEQHGLRQLHFYYAQFSEIATHSSATSVGKNFEDTSTDRRMTWAFHYFETRPQRLATFLFTLLQVSSHLEEAFFGCFEARQNLDAELVRMRAQFHDAREVQRQYLWDTYNLGSL